MPTADAASDFLDIAQSVEHQELARALAAYDLVGLPTKADVANLINYMANGLYGRMVPDGRIRLDYVNNRPDSLDVYIKGRKRP